MRRFVDKYDVILLDMHGTFMFDGDRYDDIDALQATYEDLGGKSLRSGLAGQMVADAFNWGMSLYCSNQRREQFPSSEEMLGQVPKAACLPEDETRRLLDVMAAHEVGTISPEHVQVLRQLRCTHRLGVVSDIFVASSIYQRAFQCAGIAELFDVVAWSSDIGVCKPCPDIFEYALRAFGGVPRERIVHVGDSLMSDVAGARRVGIGAVWINADPVPVLEAVRPDLVIADLQALPRCSSEATGAC